MEEIRNILDESVKKAFGLELKLEVTYADPKFGDFATNVAFKLAKEVKQSPAEIAEKLAEQLKGTSRRVAEAKAVGGFVNFTMTDDYWAGKLSEINDEYARNDLGKDQNAQVEFISANPTGPLTLANARGGFLGDTLGRVLEFSGYAVTREFYCNDYGNQINKLIESIKVSAGLVKVDEVQYKGAYVGELAEELKSDLDTKTDEELGPIVTSAVLDKYIKPAVGRMGIEFDVWFSERELVSSGQNKASKDRLREDGLLYEKDGATWLKSSQLGDQRDRVLVRSGEGATTYLDQDIAYHLNVFEKRNFDLAIKLFGPDNAAQFPSLQVTIKHLVPKADLKLLVFQSVRLIQGGKEVKMSKRAGSYVTTDELVQEVGADVARFFFLMRSADSHMDFDLDLAKETSQKNPYWYVMYSFARANSILREAKRNSLEPAKILAEPNVLERQMIKRMSMLPQLVREMAKDYGVHRLTFFGVELSKLFHDYYESERIIKLPKAEAESKLLLISQYVVFMRVYSALLGITPQAQM